MIIDSIQPANEIIGDDVPWWIKNKAPLQISPSTKSINLIKEKLGEDFMTVTESEAQEATEADETMADEYEEEEEEEEDVEQASSINTVQSA